MENIAGCNRAGNSPNMQAYTEKNSSESNLTTCFDEDDWTTNAANAVSLAFDDMDSLINLFQKESDN